MQAIKRVDGQNEYVELNEDDTVRRDHQDIDLQWEVDGITYSVYVLGYNECLKQRGGSTNYDRSWCGPGLIIQETGPMRYREDEHHVNDADIWGWIRQSIKRSWLSSETIIGEDAE